MAPVDPGRRMWPGRGLVHRVAHAEAANATDSRQTLVKTDKTAIHRTSIAATAILCAPRIVLGLGAISSTDDTDAYSQRKQQVPHGRLLVALFV
jgi:hypothetical protein